VIALCLLPAVSARADSAPTVHAAAAEVSRLLFVAGDVRRLERNPSSRGRDARRSRAVAACASASPSHSRAPRARSRANRWPCAA